MIVPISFVFEHMGTLNEMDREFAGDAAVTASVNAAITPPVSPPFTPPSQLAGVPTTMADLSVFLLCP